MELNGFQISFSKLESIQKNMQICVDGLERKAERILLGTNIPMPFNMASPEQVSVMILVLQLGLLLTMNIIDTGCSCPF